jgi:antitoxin HicB
VTYETVYFAVKLAADKRDGGYVVTCRDLPEVITQGEGVKDALAGAADALDEAIAARVSMVGIFQCRRQRSVANTR